MSRCTAIKPNGERCKGRAIEGSEWCWNHDPANASTHRTHGSRGGKRGGRGRTVVEIAEIKADIRRVIDGVADGTIENGTVLFMGYNTLLRAVEVGRKVKETDELEDRIAELEQIASETDRREA